MNPPEQPSSLLWLSKQQRPSSSTALPDLSTKQQPPTKKKKNTTTSSSTTTATTTATTTSSTSSSRRRRNDSEEQERDGDPHNIECRFVYHHEQYFWQAIEEIKNGRKESCWSWFLLPTAPYIVDGVELGSSTNRAYALRGDDAVVAYLTFPTTSITTTIHDHQQHQQQQHHSHNHNHNHQQEERRTVVNLRQNYLTLLRLIRHQLLHSERTLTDLMGSLDAVKAISSFQLFERIGRQMNDQELYGLCTDVLKLCGK